MLCDCAESAYFRLVLLRDVVELVFDVLETLMKVTLLLRLPQRALPQLVDVVVALWSCSRHQERLQQTKPSRSLLNAPTHSH